MLHISMYVLIRSFLHKHIIHLYTDEFSVAKELQWKGQKSKNSQSNEFNIYFYASLGNF